MTIKILFLITIFSVVQGSKKIAPLKKNRHERLKFPHLMLIHGNDLSSLKVSFGQGFKTPSRM